jgi:phosphatidylserine/phosphatidylglycerophosphate/cardiolipin synthase-like enzyme
LVSSDASTPDGFAPHRLGRFLTGTEAKEIADRLGDGDTLTAALRVVGSGRRPQVRELLAACGLGSLDRALTVRVLRAVEGAHSTVTTIDPLWTMPGHLAKGGALTGSLDRLVDDARQALICSTYNFARSSVLWESLRRAACRAEMTVRVYVDTRAADADPKPWVPTTSQVAAHLHPAAVLRTKDYDGSYVRNHAKFLAIDHRFLLVTSANFSWSAEQGNVEFGALIDNVGLTESVEREMLAAEDSLYERVKLDRPDD